MALFFVRVELHGATLADYNALHNAMAKAGFSRTVRADDGKVYNLPTAEYSVDGNYTVKQVATEARTAADSTGKANIVLASESARWSGYGMTPA